MEAIEDDNGEMKHTTTRRAKGHQSLEMSGVVSLSLVQNMA